MSWRRWRHHSAAFDSVPDMFCLHTTHWDESNPEFLSINRENLTLLVRRTHAVEFIIR